MELNRMDMNVVKGWIQMFMQNGYKYVYIERMDKNVDTERMAV